MSEKQIAIMFFLSPFVPLWIAFVIVEARRAMSQAGDSFNAE
jgi:hypothetical protein